MTITSKKVGNLEFVPYKSAGEIAQEVNRLGKEITEVYQDKNPLLVCVLNGAFVFASDLAKRIDLELEIMFVRFKSYEGTESTGKIKTVLGFNDQVKGKDVIIVEDIIDSGLTIQYLVQEIERFSPKSVAVAALLHKPEATVHPVKIDYLAFAIENKFVVGYGLDYDEKGRNIPEILQLKS